MDKTPLTLANVPGYADRRNSIKYLPPVENSDNSVVIYFGGDVQYSLDGNETDERYADYEPWSLKNMPKLLSDKFPASHIIIIYPVSYMAEISCFNNFVISLQIGVPHHTANNNALIHLKLLLQNSSVGINKYLNQNNNQQTDEPKASTSATQPESSTAKGELDFTNSKLILIGFSKGCVVLNQFLYEFHYAEMFKDKEISDFMDNISDIYFLDAGHKGRKNTWITSSSLLDTLARSGINVHVHVTPYQVYDISRSWIQKDLNKFLNLIQQSGADVEYQFHFQDEQYSFLRHFQVLNVFKAPNNSRENT